MENPITSLTLGGRNGNIFPSFQLTGAGAEILSFLFTPSNETPSHSIISPVPALHLRVWYNKRKNHRGSLHQERVNPAKKPAPHSHPDQVPMKLTLARSKARDTHPSQPNGGLWQPTTTTNAMRNSPNNEGKIHI